MVIRYVVQSFVCTRTSTRIFHIFTSLRDVHFFCHGAYVRTKDILRRGVIPAASWRGRSRQPCRLRVRLYRFFLYNDIKNDAIPVACQRTFACRADTLDAATEAEISFEDVGNWYNTGGFEVIPWLELLDLRKWCGRLGGWVCTRAWVHHVPLC